jgi:hypothetical protein
MPMVDWNQQASAALKEVQLRPGECALLAATEVSRWHALAACSAMPTWLRLRVTDHSLAQAAIIMIVSGILCACRYVECQRCIQRQDSDRLLI